MAGPVTRFDVLAGDQRQQGDSVSLSVGQHQAVVDDDPAATRSVTEQPLTGSGYDLMAVSNAYGPPFDQAQSASQLTTLFAMLFSGVAAVAPRGAEKFTWNTADRTLESAWSDTTVSCPNGIPSMSTATAMAYCWGARGSSRTLEAIDWHIGASVFRRDIGPGSDNNSAYAGTEIGAFGAVVTGTLGGATAVRR